MKTICCLVIWISVASFSAGAQTFLTNGLVSYYPFNGSANDEAGTNDGTPTGATLTLDRFGNTNAAYAFDGKSWIATAQQRLLDGASNATITAWVLLDSGTHGQILGCGDSRTGFDPISLIFEPQLAYGTWFENCLLGNSTATTIGEGSTHGHHTLTNLTAGLWHQIDVVLSTANPAGTYTIYVDGLTNYAQTASDDGVTPFAKISYDTNMQFVIGGLNNGPTSSTPIELWTGDLDDIRIYDRALSPREIHLLHEYEASSPQIIVDDGGFGVRNGVFGFDVAAAYGATVVVEASTNLVSWTALATNTVAGVPFSFSDQAEGGGALRFYRAKLQ